MHPPLIRYHIADEGGLIPYHRMLGFLHEHAFHPGVEGPELPFTYIFGRSHFTVSYYGANIYPYSRQGEYSSANRMRG